MRTRQVDGCQQNSQWSDWSQTISEFCLLKSSPRIVWLVDIWMPEYTMLYLINAVTSVQLSASLCVCVCRGGTVSLRTQHSGDYLNFTWNTHDPFGCASVGVPSEVLCLSVSVWMTNLLTDAWSTCSHSYTASHRLVTSLHTCFSFFHLPLWAVSNLITQTLSSLLKAGPPTSAEAVKLSEQAECRKEKWEECTDGDNVFFFLKSHRKTSTLNVFKVQTETPLSDF